jgi:hypothetical protein
MMTRGVLYVAAILTAAGCGWPGAGPLSGQTTAPTFTWDGVLADGETLEIKGVNGSIQAVPASGSRASVVATRSARRSDPTEVEIVVVEHSEGITICAVYPSSGLNRNECLPGDEGRLGARNNDVQVEFTVQVPAEVDFVARTTNGEVNTISLAGRVEAYSTNGDVAIDGASSAIARTTNGSVVIRSAGEADAHTTNGEIEAYLQDLSAATPLDFSTTNGSITVGLPSTTNASIDARTTNGRITSDLPITVQGSMRRNRLEGMIGNGGREIRLRTTNGSIRLERSS